MSHCLVVKVDNRVLAELREDGLILAVPPVFEIGDDEDNVLILMEEGVDGDVERYDPIVEIME